MTTQTSQQNLKELYQKDFYLWIQKNLEFLKSKNFDAVDWDNLIEELETMGRTEIRKMISFMTIILEHLYKWEHFKFNEKIGNSWVRSIIHARLRLKDIFEENPSLKNQFQTELERAWKKAIENLIAWFKKPENIKLAKKLFGKIPTEKDFPSQCPYTLQQILHYKPWMEE